MPDLRSPYGKLWWLTNLLLLVMLAVFLAASRAQAHWPWLSYVVAFAEAAMVGGIADWFAVTALFRRPFGLPIPHTGLIPRNQPRIAANIAKFTSDNFLEDAAVARRLEGIDIVGMAVEKMRDPAQVAGVLRAILLPLLKSMDDPAIAAAARATSLDQLRKLDSASVLAELLTAVQAGGHHRAVLDRVLDAAADWIPANRDLILSKIQQASYWLIPGVVDKFLADRLVSALTDACLEMRSPDSSLRARLEQALDDFRRRLAEDPVLRGRIGHLTDSLLDEPAVQDRFETVWNDLRHRMIADLDSPHGTITRLLTEILTGLGQRMASDPDRRETINHWLRQTARDLLQHYRPALVAHIEQTIKGWDSHQLVGKIEQEVGRDLQFIRINGTLVGGLIGLLIHAVGEML